MDKSRKVIVAIVVAIIALLIIVSQQYEIAKAPAEVSTESGGYGGGGYGQESGGYGKQ